VTRDLSQKDLIILVADKNMEAAMTSILLRPESLGIRELGFDIFVHPYHDPGCLLDAHSFLRPFGQRYLFSAVLFDKEGCGQESKSVEVLQEGTEKLLSQSGWANRSCAIAIDPELETWIWKNSIHVSNAIGWENNLDGLYSWLRKNGYLEENQTRPARPKEALEAALRNVKKPRSSSIYAELGRKLSLKKCADPSFLRLKFYLQACFSFTEI